MASRNAGTVRRLGRGLADQPGRRAGGAHPGTGRADRLPSGDVGTVCPTREAEGTRAPVLELRSVPREDVPSASVEHAPLTRDGTRGGSDVRRGGGPRAAALRGAGRGG